VPKKRRSQQESLVDGHYSRVWGLIPEDQDVAFNHFGERDTSLPDRDDIAALLSSGQYSLKSTCVNPHAIAFLERTTELQGVILYIVDIMDNGGPTTLQAMIGLGRGSPETVTETLRSDPELRRPKNDVRPNPYGSENFAVTDERGYDTLRPSEWLQVVKERAFDDMTKAVDRMVNGKVKKGQRDAVVMKQLFSNMSSNDPFACFYIDWACSATVFTAVDGDQVDPRRPGSEKGAGTLLVHRMAEYIDTAYVLPTAVAALRELWPGVNTGMLTHAQSLSEVTKWVRRRTWIKLKSLAQARVFWEDVIGFQQLGNTYNRDEQAYMCRLVFPDLVGPTPPPKGPKPLFGTVPAPSAPVVVVPASVYDRELYGDVVVIPAKVLAPRYTPSPNPPQSNKEDDDEDDGDADDDEDDKDGGDAIIDDDDVMSRYMGLLGHTGDSSDDDFDDGDVVYAPRSAQRQRTSAVAGGGGGGYVVHCSNVGLPCLAKLVL